MEGNLKQPIGAFQPKNGLFLAPLAGITDKSFRRLCRECGAALVYTEMVSAKALWYGDKNTAKLLETCPEERPVVFQIFGSDPEAMAFAAKMLDKRENVILDVNMGCPVPKVAGNGDGSALMRDPDKAGRLIEAMRANTTKPVTAKIRAGWDAENKNAVEFAQTLESAGASAICVHGRTRDQFYSGRSDRGVIARVKAAVKIPVIGNGDVFCADDAARLMDETGCDYVMAARGALGNPWIFAEARDAENFTPPTLAEKARMFLRHARLTAEDKGERSAVLEMRKHAGWYFKGAEGAAKFRGRVNRAATLAELEEEVALFCRSCAFLPLT